MVGHKALRDLAGRAHDRLRPGDFTAQFDRRHGGSSHSRGSPIVDASEMDVTMKATTNNTIRIISILLPAAPRLNT